MVREEKITKARTLSQSIMLLSKRQLYRFSAVVAWYQVHHNLNYFFDERNSKHLFIDLFIGKRLNNRPINERRIIVLNHLEMYLIEDMEKSLIALAKAAAEGKTVKELNDVGWGSSKDEMF